MSVAGAAAGLARVAAAGVAAAGLAALGCAVPVDNEPTVIEVPGDVFSDEAAPEAAAATPDTTRHPVFFLRDGLLVEVVRELASPVFLEAPLNDLLAGPTEDEAEEGLESAIPAGVEIVDVQLQRDNVVSLHLSPVFFEVEGAQRIRATAQLVLTASALADNTQGVLFFLDGRALTLPDGTGAIAQPEEGRLPRPLRTEDFAELLPAESGVASS
ncbi:MAG TPA: hypothetical protein DEP66_02595 [Acidimicrobiaceae bacterium]|nr:hypothetical protein [Acidimicrobiaceae bacterium]HCB37112.1 hypothetical protein [Acidimicrobiaceae bacterium]